MPDLSALRINSTIVHYVETKKDSGDPQLMLTSEAIDLDEELTAYFRSKVADRLEHKGLDVVIDDEKPQVVPDALLAILRTPDELVAQSQVVAERLFEIQGKSNSSGLLAVMHCSLGTNASCVAVVKLERQRGVSFQIDRQTGTVDLELLRNLTLTDKTKVYKTAVFGLAAGALTGVVADDQRTSAKGSPVAGFFLSGFLGCKPKEPAALITYRFANAATRAITTIDAGPEIRGRYQVGLLSVLQDNSTDINPQGFAAKYLEKGHREPFLEAVAKAGVDPTVSFAKDTSRISVKQFQVTFKSGMVLVGPPDAWGEHVDMPDTPSADDPVQLRDSVSSVLTSR